MWWWQNAFQIHQRTPWAWTSANHSSCPCNTKDGCTIFSSYKPGQLHVLAGRRAGLYTIGKLPCFSSTRATVFCSCFCADGLETVSSTISKSDTCSRGAELTIGTIWNLNVGSWQCALAMEQIATIGITIAACNFLSAPWEPLSMSSNTGRQ